MQISAIVQTQGGKQYPKEKHTSEKLPTAAVFHAQVEVVLRLEGVIQCHDEGVVARGQNLLLRQCPLDLIPLDHFLLAEHYLFPSVAHILPCT